MCKDHLAPVAYEHVHGNQSVTFCSPPRDYGLRRRNRPLPVEVVYERLKKLVICTSLEFSQLLPGPPPERAHKVHDAAEPIRQPLRLLEQRPEVESLRTSKHSALL